MKIKLLSENTINRIAAGEVIERPASVIKELVENSIDAKARNIDIILERAGKNLIIIADDGTGMSQEDLLLSIQRHTTSKLDEDDFLNINSFGFRGEALPSIASISKMTIISKQIDQDKGYKLEVVGGSVKSPVPITSNIGTRIEIRDLFFATPARLKFLRSDRTELNACIDIVKQIALSHPFISFSLSHDGKQLLKVKKGKEDFKTALTARLDDIISNDFANNTALVELVNPDLSIIGYVSLPTYHRATSDQQFLYINNRPVKDKLINIALKIAYQDYISRDKFPIAALFLNIPPHLVDVNVHPAKSEVRFQEPNLVKNLLINAIKDALSSTSHKVSTTLSNTALNYFNIPSFKPSTPSFDIIQNNLPNDNNKSLDLNITAAEPSGPKYITQPTDLYKLQAKFVDSPPSTKTYNSIPDSSISSTNSENYSLGAAKAQFHATYIISQTTDSIIIVDQHAAHERLTYEKIKQHLLTREITKQRLLIPEIIELPDEHRAHLLDEYKQKLSELGLTIEKFGDKSIIVSEIPALLGEVNVPQLINNLSDHLLSWGDQTALTELIEHVTETYACHHSIRAGRELNIIEMNELLRQMENTPFSGQCNHGRPTYIELKVKDIEKLFGRK